MELNKQNLQKIYIALLVICCLMLGFFIGSTRGDQINEGVCHALLGK